MSDSHEVNSAIRHWTKGIDKRFTYRTLSPEHIITRHDQRPVWNTVETYARYKASVETQDIGSTSR